MSNMLQDNKIGKNNPCRNQILVGGTYNENIKVKIFSMKIPNNQNFVLAFLS